MTRHRQHRKLHEEMLYGGLGKISPGAVPSSPFGLPIVHPCLFFVVPALLAHFSNWCLSLWLLFKVFGILHVLTNKAPPRGSRGSFRRIVSVDYWVVDVACGGCGLSASFVVDCYLVVPTERANRTSGTNQNHIDSGLFPFERLFL